MPSKTLLLIEDDDQMSEILSLLLKSKLNLNVIEVAAVSSAITILRSNQVVDCILSDYQLCDGNTYSVYQVAKEKNINLPFILCTGRDFNNLEFKNTDQLSAIVPKPFKFEKVAESVMNALAETSMAGFGNSEESSGYLPIRVSTLFKLKSRFANFYIKISDSKFVKIASDRDEFTLDDLERNRDKKISVLYLKKVEIPEFLDRYSQELLGNNLGSELEGIVEGASDILLDLVPNLGFPDSIHNFAKVAIKVVLTLAINEKNLAHYFQHIELDRGNFLSSHGVVLGLVACMIALSLGFKDNDDLYRLGFAAICHDLTLKNESEARLELQAWNDESQGFELGLLSTSFRTHQRDCIELLGNIHVIPEGVENILQTHHERPNGRGYPNRLDSSQLGVMESIFIFAHDLVNYAWFSEGGVDFKFFLDKRKSVYRSDYFGIIYAKCIDNLDLQRERVL